MFVAPEIIIISTGIISILGCIVQIIGLVIRGRRTTTHIYIGYTTFLWLLALFTSPTLHHLYTSDFFEDYEVRDFLSLVCLVLIVGNMTMVMLLFFMDYFRWISAYVTPVIISHFVFSILFTTLYYFFVERIPAHTILIVGLLVIVWIMFLLVFLLHRDLECLKKRKQTDDESSLRYFVALVFITVKIIQIVLYSIEFSAAILFRSPIDSFITVALSQMDSVWLLVILLKVDHIFRTKLVEFFKMCSCRTRNKVRFENLPSDNGRLLNEAV